MGLCDAKDAYLVNAKVYLGKELGRPEINQGENVVKTLCEPILKTGRNVTTDNFFTTRSLARYLLDQKITIVGTVRENTKFLPEEFQSSKGDAGDIKFPFPRKDHTPQIQNPKKEQVSSSFIHSTP